MASFLSALPVKLEGVGTTVANKGKSMLDSFFPPERRAELLAKLQAFVLRNPKLSAFLATNIALTGFPLFIFALFSLTVLVFSIVVALVVGLLVAVAFTVFCVGLALLVLFPVVFFTTLVACFLVLWGLGGYYLLKYFNKGKSPAPPGTAIGDKLNDITGGKLGFLMGEARTQQKDSKAGRDTEKELKNEYQPGQNKLTEQQPVPGENDAKTTGHSRQLNATPNGTPKKMVKSPAGTPDVKKHVGDGVNGVKKNVNPDGAKRAAGGATKQVNPDNAVSQVNGGINKAGKTTGLDSVTGKATTATGTVKGTVGGLTGLT